MLSWPMHMKLKLGCKAEGKGPGSRLGGKQTPHLKVDAACVGGNLGLVKEGGKIASQLVVAQIEHVLQDLAVLKLHCLLQTSNPAQQTMSTAHVPTPRGGLNMTCREFTIRINQQGGTHESQYDHQEAASHLKAR